MYLHSCRRILFSLRGQFTCTARPSVTSPSRSYHIYSSFLVRSPNLHKANFLNVGRPLSLSLTSRNASTDSTIPVQSDAVLNIPAPPVIPTAPTDSVTEAVTRSIATEPSFAEIGLGGWSPSGMIQSCLEFLYTTTGLPWWGCIAIGVVTVRFIMFPLVVKSQQNAARMHNNMPQLQVLQHKMTQARQSGNALQTAQLAHEMQSFMKEKGVNPFKNMLVPLIQAPVFMSFFFGLKGMANAPVQSMTHGGLFWFTDLTVADPYYLLPFFTSLTMWLTIELGTDAARLGSGGSPLMIYVLRALPVFMFPITINFSGAILCYWLTTNLVSLVQVGFLRIPRVREFFKIERLAPVPTLPGGSNEKKGFRQSVKEAWTNQKITAELSERQRLMETNFNKAGTGPIQKTYSYDPTRITAQQIVQRGFKETKKSS